MCDVGGLILQQPDIDWRTVSEWLGAMPTLQGGDLASWCGGTWKPPSPTVSANGVSTDTRSIQPGNLYVALRGPRCDGHDFIADAFARHAAAAVVERSSAAAEAPHSPLLLVDDTLKALRDLAAHYRNTLSGEILAVTGSVGKTTVKEMIADVLATSASTARTRGNWNNEIGLPLSLITMEAGDVYGVFELGMNHPGELAPLCGIARPTWGVITNVGPVHIEFFDSVQSIAKEKATVFRCLPKDGTAILSRDEAMFDLLVEEAPCRIVTTGIRRDADFQGLLDKERPGHFAVIERATGERAEFQLPLPGEHVVANALLAIAVGRLHGLPWDNLKAALGQYKPPPMRWNRTSLGGVVVINDAYNANPMSMKSALSAFGQTPVKGRRWLVLGGMRELGEAERREHEALGVEIARGTWAGLVTIGPLAVMIADAATAAAGRSLKVFRCDDHAGAAAVLAQGVKAGDAVLLKGSRGEQVEKVLDIWKKSTDAKA